MEKRMSGDEGRTAQTLEVGGGGIEGEIAAFERKLQKSYAAAASALMQAAIQERKREKSHEISRIDAKMDIMRMRGRPKLTGRRGYDRKMLSMLGYVGALATESNNRSATMDMAKADYDRIVAERKEIRALLRNAWERRLEHAEDIANGAGTGHPGGMATYADRIAEMTGIDALMGDLLEELEAKNRQLLDAETGVCLMEESIRCKRSTLKEYRKELARRGSSGRIMRTLTKTNDKIREIREKLAHIEAEIARNEQVKAEKSEEYRRLQSEIGGTTQTFKQLWAARHKISLKLEISEMHRSAAFQKGAGGPVGVATGEQLVEGVERPLHVSKGRIETSIEKIMEWDRTAGVPKAGETKVQKKDGGGEAQRGEKEDAEKSKPLGGSKGRIEAALDEADKKRKARKGQHIQEPEAAPEAPRLDARAIVEYAKLLREKEKWGNRNSRLPDEKGIRDGFRRYVKEAVATAQAGSVQAIKEIYSLVGWEYNNARRGMTRFERFAAWMRKPAVALSRIAGGYAAGFGAMALMHYTAAGGIALACAALTIGAAGRFVGTVAAWEKMHELKTRWFGDSIYALGSQVFYRTKEKKLGRIADRAFGTGIGNAAETAERIDAALVDYADSIARQKPAKHLFAALAAAAGCIPGLKYLGAENGSNAVAPEGKGQAASLKAGEAAHPTGKPPLGEAKPEVGSGKAASDAAAGTAEFAPLRSHGVWHVAKAAAGQISGFENLSKHDRMVVVDAIKKYIIDNQGRVGLSPEMVMDIGGNGPGLKENAIVRLNAEDMTEAMKKVPKTIRHALSLDRWAPAAGDIRRVAFRGAAASRKFAMAGI